MTFNVVCHVRITPIRGVNLRRETTEGFVEPSNPCIMGQINPWRKKTKSKPIESVVGSNPIWPSTVKAYIDLPYFGHPLPGKRPTLTLILLDAVEPKEDGIESEDDDGRKYAYRSIGTAEVDLAAYLNQKITGRYDLDLKLKNKNNTSTGTLVCSLQFSLVGQVRLTILSGNRLRSVEPKPDQEPYVEAKLYPSRAKKIEKTNHKFGENPQWGQYSRQPSLIGFASSRFFTEAQVKKRKGPNVLEFKFRDEDRGKPPLVLLQVKDKMDTILKQEKREKLESERMKRIEDEIRALKWQEDLARKKRAKPRYSKQRRMRRMQGSFFNLFVRANELEEEEEEEDLEPLSEEEEAIAHKYAELMKQKNEASVGSESPEDRLIGKGAIDLRPILKYDGVREPLYVTVDLTDENDLTAGTLSCMLEFENAAYDKNNKEVLRLPEFDNMSIRTLMKMNSKQLVLEMQKLYLFFEIQLDTYGPPFIVRTSHQTGVSKVVLTLATALISLLFLASLWFGLGSRTISYLLGVMYPVYQSYKALESRSREDGTQWLTYWIVYGCFNLFENTVMRPFIFIYPITFYVFKMLFIYWLIDPGSLGATLIYHVFLAPLIRSKENEIDSAMLTFGEAAKEAAKDFAGIREQLQDEFKAVSASKVDEKEDDEAEDDEEDEEDGKRVFIALLDKPEEPKMMIISKSKPWENVLKSVARKLKMTGDVELIMLVNENVTVTIDQDNRTGIRENDRLYLKKADDVVRLQYIERESFDQI